MLRARVPGGYRMRILPEFPPVVEVIDGQAVRSFLDRIVQVSPAPAQGLTTGRYRNARLLLMVRLSESGLPWRASRGWSALIDTSLWTASAACVGSFRRRRSRRCRVSEVALIGH